MNNSAGAERMILRISVCRRDHSGSGQHRSADEQSLVLLEGAVAALALDQEIPVLTVAPSGAVTGSFVPLGNVLELKPVPAGAQVRLELRQRHARMNGDNIDSRGVQSVLLLTPGVWTDLGAINSNGQDRSARIDSAGNAQYRAGTDTRDSGWQVRVELLAP